MSYSNIQDIYYSFHNSSHNNCNNNFSFSSQIFQLHPISNSCTCYIYHVGSLDEHFNTLIKTINFNDFYCSISQINLTFSHIKYSPFHFLKFCFTDKNNSILFNIFYSFCPLDSYYSANNYTYSLSSYNLVSFSNNKNLLYGTYILFFSSDELFFPFYIFPSHISFDDVINKVYNFINNEYRNFF